MAQPLSHLAAGQKGASYAPRQGTGPGRTEESVPQVAARRGLGAMAVMEGQLCLCRVLLEPLQSKPFTLQSVLSLPSLHYTLPEYGLRGIARPVLQTQVCAGLGQDGPLHALRVLFSA